MGWRDNMRFLNQTELYLEELDQNIDNYCQNRVPKILCQARVDAVKKFYGKDAKGQNLSDVELQLEQYLTCRLYWFNEDA